MPEARYDAVADFYATAFNAFRGHGLWLDELREPVPASQWADSRSGADRVPVYLAGRCLKVRLPAG